MHKREESADAASIGVFMIDAKGVAASLQIGESSVWKLVKYEPDFPKPIKFGRLSRFKVDEVTAWKDRIKGGTVLLAQTEDENVAYEEAPAVVRGFFFGAPGSARVIVW